MTKQIAIITGASSGLGAEFARQLDVTEKLDDIWLIARREDRLKEVSDQVNTSTRIFSLDLTKMESFQSINETLRKEKPEVRFLINAAGFGKIGSWKDISLEDCNSMIDLNCRAAVDMTQLVLPYMKKGSHVLEICSTAAFQPFQFLNIYSASKAFLYRYSRALRLELFSQGIHVIAVCPYWVKDTEFISKAQKTSDSSYICHFPLASREKRVVRHALMDARLGLPVSTPGLICTIHRVAAKIIPHEIMMGIWALLRRC